MIRMNGIEKVYKGEYFETVALEDICLNIKKGEMVAIMGESGSGKTSLINIMGFLDAATQGEYFFDGEDVSRISVQDLWKYRRKHIGFVFQDFALIDTLTVKENVMIPLDALGIPRKEKKERVNEALRSVHISDLAEKYPPQISGGQRQRAAIARAIITDPDIILADEPTGALDHNTGMLVMDLFSKLHNDGHTIVIVTHDKSIADMTERVIQLEGGRMVSCHTIS